MTASSKKTSATYRSIDAISVASIRQMYAIYEKYYERTSLEIFLRDLSKKSGVILIQRKSDDEIVGFSTLQFFDFEVVFYYWMHRAGHRIRWYWASHQVHHSGNQFNLAAAFRQVEVERALHLIDGGDVVGAHRRQAHDRQGHRHRIGRELTAADLDRQPARRCHPAFVYSLNVRLRDSPCVAAGHIERPL